MKSQITVSLVLAFATAFLPPAQAKQMRFDFRDAALRNLVQFTSDSNLDRVVGISSLVAGWIEIDPMNLGEGVRGEFETDLRGFETGMDARNDWLRDKVFVAAESPAAIVSIQRWIQSPRGKLSDGNHVTAKVETLVKIRGVSRGGTGTLKLSYFRENESTKKRLNGNLLRATLTLEADSSAYGFIQTDTVRTLARTVQFQWDLVGSDNLPLPGTPVADGPKAKDKRQN